MKVIGYVRRNKGDTDALGLRAQERTIRDTCAARGWELVGILEEVKTAKKASNRPRLQEAFGMLRKGAADGLVVAKLDRLARSVVDAGQLLDEAQRRGWVIVALDLGIDLSTPTGRLIANVIIAAAQWEREMMGQRIREALAEKRVQGGDFSRPKQVSENVRQLIIALQATGLSQRAIAARLNEDGVPALGTRWHRGTVTRVLEQEARAAA